MPRCLGRSQNQEAASLSFGCLGIEPSSKSHEQGQFARHIRRGCLAFANMVSLYLLVVVGFGPAPALFFTLSRLLGGAFVIHFTTHDLMFQSVPLGPSAVV